MATGSIKKNQMERPIDYSSLPLLTLSLFYHYSWSINSFEEEKLLRFSIRSVGDDTYTEVTTKWLKKNRREKRDGLSCFGCVAVLAGVCGPPGVTNWHTEAAWYSDARAANLVAI